MEVRGLPGYWAVLVRACRDSTPRPLLVLLPINEFELLPSSCPGTLGFVALNYSFGAISRGPLARLPTHRRIRRRVRRKAGYWPAGLSFGQAGLSPAGRLFKISGAPLSLLPS